MRKQNARQRILDTAASLFAERGYGSVGINEIIEKSETAKASFYQHFPSKETLCSTWLGDAHDRSETTHQAILESSDPPLKKLKDYFASLKTWLEGNGHRGCPYTNTAAVLEGDAAGVREQIETHKLFLRDFFVSLAAEIVKGKRAKELGAAWFLLYSGATIESQNLRASWPVDAALKAAVELGRNAQAAG